MLGAPMGGRCLDALAARAQEQLPHFDATAMATMLWAFARLRYKPDAVLLRSCEAHAACNIASFAPRDLVCCYLPSEWTRAVLAHGTLARLFAVCSHYRKNCRAWDYIRDSMSCVMLMIGLFTCVFKGSQAADGGVGHVPVGVCNAAGAHGCCLPGFDGGTGAGVPAALRIHGCRGHSLGSCQAGTRCGHFAAARL